jgi:hypothetical protein
VNRFRRRKASSGRLRFKPGLLIGVAMLTVGCRGVPRVPAEGIVAAQRVATTVDSEIAKHYLEQYLPGRRNHERHDAAIGRAVSEADAGPLDRETLRRLSRRTSPDLATLYFASRLHSVPADRRLHDEHADWLERLSDGGIYSRAPEALGSYLLVFAPGYGWRMDPSTGADFARQRLLLGRQGFRTHLIESDELGSVEANADLIAEALEQLANRHERMIVISTSKAGPEVALALGELVPEASLARVRAWVSIGGLLRGSPLADRWGRWPRSWAGWLILKSQGLDPAVISNLRTRKRTGVFERLRFPEHLLMVQYIGTPLSGQVGLSAWGRYRTMRRLGPNDGLTLLADELVPGGHVIAAIGLDHFYRHPAIDLKTLALAYTVIGELEGEGTAGGSGVRRGDGQEAERISEADVVSCGRFDGGERPAAAEQIVD